MQTVFISEPDVKGVQKRAQRQQHWQFIMPSFRCISLNVFESEDIISKYDSFALVSIMKNTNAGKELLKSSLNRRHTFMNLHCPLENLKVSSLFTLMYYN